MNCGTNVTVPACSTQAQVNAAYAAFLASTTASGGCGGVLTNNCPTPPSACGGFRDVTWTYTVSSSCGAYPPGCDSNGRITCTRRFTVASAPAVSFNCGSNVTIPSCKTQAEVNAAYAAFLCSTTASGGCGGVLRNNAPSQAPSACGGFVDVTWTYTVSNVCGTYPAGCNSNGQVTCTRRFTVNSGGAVDVAGPGSVSYVNTSFNSQYAVNCAFTNWLAQFRTISSGCGACAVFSGDNRVAPSWTNGGTVRVCYSITGRCNSDSVCATFTITRNHSTCKAGTPEVKNEMVAKAYPNPFTENFNIELTSSSVDKVGVTIYDMTGKLIEQREVSSEEVSTLQVGERFPTGVYNVILTQGTEVKTLRVIKR